MANALYDHGRQSILEGSIAFLTDSIKVAFVTSGYTPNLSTHQFYSDLTPASNVAGTPLALASKTTTAGVANGANVTFTSFTGTNVTYIVLYKDTGTTTTSPLIACIDTATGLPFSITNGSVTISWDTGANKIFKL